jgi:hypothetical protein
MAAGTKSPPHPTPMARQTRRGPGPPECRGFTIILGRTPLYEWSAQRAETSTWQHITLTRDIHGLSGIRTRNPRQWAAADTRLSPRNHWDQSWKRNSRENYLQIQKTQQILTDNIKALKLLSLIRPLETSDQTQTSADQYNYTNLKSPSSSKRFLQLYLCRRYTHCF